MIGGGGGCGGGVKRSGPIRLVPISSYSGIRQPGTYPLQGYPPAFSSLVSVYTLGSRETW